MHRDDPTDPAKPRETAALPVGKDGAFMTPLVTAYTHLESLLLFQALRCEGVNTISFNRISDQLKSVPLVRNDPDFDAGRLSPDALRELYLGLLKEEVKHDLEQQQNGEKHLTNGDASPGTRKRKVASPVLPTVHEAAQHSHLIPQLVTRLYSRYRENTVLKIKGYESRYTENKQHIDDIEAGAWDDRLQREDNAKRTHERTVSQAQSPRPSPKPSSTAHTQPLVARQESVRTPSANASPILPKPAESTGPKRYSQAKIDAVINHGPEPQDSSGSHRRVSSNTKLPPLSDMAPQSPHFGIPPKISGQAPQQMQAMPSHAQPPSHSYGQTPPSSHQSPYGPHHAHPRQGSISSPQIQQSLSRPSSSPRPILPPPPGMSLPSPSPIPHTGSPGQHHYPPAMQQQQQHYQPQHRPPPGPPPVGYQGSPLPPHASNYYPPPSLPQQPSYQDRRSSYQPQHPQTTSYPHQPHMQPHPSQMHQAGFMQPFQVAPQEPSRQLHHQAIRPQPAPTAHLSNAPPYVAHGTPATAPRLAPQPSRKMSDVLHMLATPPRPRIKPLWKEKYQPSPLVPSAEKPRPLVEPLSPTQDRRSPAWSMRANRGQDATSVNEPLQADVSSRSRTSKRRPQARDKSPGANSVVSSTAEESLRARTRSQSVSTAAGTATLPEDYVAGHSGVKMEPSTPADSFEDATAPSATPASGRVTRKRRGTLQSQHQPPSKRKRHESPSREDDGESSTPAPRSNIVIATRNFNKMSSAVMNDILSHKHAAYFAGPVRDKDAPGYSDIVRQPQNLKTIKAAITAGTHVVKAAASAIESPSDGSNTISATVELERTTDTTPSKVIVNAAQLEKELMRMFANAYMFNPGEDGMALSTKEMFFDVEKTISEWRGTERTNDEDDDSKGKRRKL
ncbi:Putative bromodomain-containing protein [Septoria linicola]|uniref:Bromodomain-containing protein n=1 Tax=Septoria linicola TaxID=215465 RepID=A0A9Q9AJB3_9PEZI|nr:putative bromodomain-containing protein [Septoria linicola]USW47142.1 Putative bromodomain-containing protein [Septoria linicola]